jgi:hypothetical protein
VAVLVDGHCHAVLAADLDRPAFELACTEADLPPPPGLSYLDSQLGLAVRRWCAPALDLPASVGIDDYLARRADLGWSAVTSALLRAAGLSALLVDTGLDGSLVSLDAPSPPAPREVRRAAGDWLRTGGRLTDPVLLRHVLWAGVDTGLPVQLHTGFGDRDLALRGADPALAQPFLAAVPVPVILLHCYPYHRQAGWLAQVYPHVYVDVGLTVGHLGVRAGAVLAEYFELAPFGKVLFSTDAYLLPELYLVGAAQFRHALRGLLDGWLADGAIPAADAERVEGLVSGGNARRIYRDLPAAR